MLVTNIITYKTHVVDIYDEVGAMWSVTMAENDFGWDTKKVDTEGLDELDKNDELYQKLVDAALIAIDSYDKGDGSHHCDDLDCNCSI